MPTLLAMGSPEQATSIRQIAANLFHHAAKPPSENTRQKAWGEIVRKHVPWGSQTEWFEWLFEFRLQMIKTILFSHV